MLAGLLFAAKKTDESISLCHSSLLGGASMNASLALSVFMALIYFRGLTWSFSAEIITVFLVTAIVAVNSLWNTVRLWQVLCVCVCFFEFGQFSFFLPGCACEFALSSVNPVYLLARKQSWLGLNIIMPKFTCKFSAFFVRVLCDMANWLDRINAAGVSLIYFDLRQSPLFSNVLTLTDKDACEIAVILADPVLIQYISLFIFPRSFICPFFQSTRLTCLDLSHTSSIIGDEGLIALAESLKRNSVLVSLCESLDLLSCQNCSKLLP